MEYRIFPGPLLSMFLNVLSFIIILYGYVLVTWKHPPVYPPNIFENEHPEISMLIDPSIEKVPP